MTKLKSNFFSNFILFSFFCVANTSATSTAFETAHASDFSSFVNNNKEADILNQILVNSQARLEKLVPYIEQALSDKNLSPALKIKLQTILKDIKQTHCEDPNQLKILGFPIDSGFLLRRGVVATTFTFLLLDLIFYIKWHREFLYEIRTQIWH